MIPLVEHNPDDEVLALRALTKTNIATEVAVAHDGVEALEFLFGTGTFSERDLKIQPQVILLDLNCRGSTVWKSSGACATTRELACCLSSF